MRKIQKTNVSYIQVYDIEDDFVLRKTIRNTHF